MRWKELLLVMSVVALVAWFGTKPTFGGQVPEAPPSPNYFRDAPKAPSKDATLPSTYQKDPNPLAYTDPDDTPYFVDDSNQAPYAAIELSVRPAKAFADTEFRVKIRAAVPTMVGDVGENGLPSQVYLVVHQGDKEWTLLRKYGRMIREEKPRRQLPLLPAGYQAEWTVHGSDLSECVGVDQISKAGPSEIKAVLRTSDPHSSKFSRGSRMLNYTSNSIAING